MTTQKEWTYKENCTERLNKSGGFTINWTTNHQLTHGAVILNNTYLLHNKWYLHNVLRSQ